MSQHKILTKLTTSLYRLIQPCQVNYIFILNLFYYNIKEKDPIRRKINDKKNCLYVKSVLFSFTKN